MLEQYLPHEVLEYTTRYLDGWSFGRLQCANVQLSKLKRLDVLKVLGYLRVWICIKKASKMYLHRLSVDLKYRAIYYDDGDPLNRRFIYHHDMGLYPSRLSHICFRKGAFIPTDPLYSRYLSRLFGSFEMLLGAARSLVDHHFSATFQLMGFRWTMENYVARVEE